ncbi:MAG: hypothetical protein WCW47_01165 [Candidatus Paceibacterota bacterium]|jgi:hypothetical protein
MEGENKSSVGSIIATIIIIAIIILGGLYFWGKRLEENKSKEDLITSFTPGTTETNGTEATTSVSSSDDLNSIEADLNATVLDGLDADLQ